MLQPRFAQINHTFRLFTAVEARTMAVVWIMLQKALEICMVVLYGARAWNILLQSPASAFGVAVANPTCLRHPSDGMVMSRFFDAGEEEEAGEARRFEALGS